MGNESKKGSKTTKRRAKPLTKPVTTKKPRRTTSRRKTKSEKLAEERKTYFKVGAVIASVCVVLFCVTFFVIPTLKSDAKNSSTIARAEDERKTEEQTKPKRQNQTVREKQKKTTVIESEKAKQKTVVEESAKKPSVEKTVDVQAKKPPVESTPKVKTEPVKKQKAVEKVKTEPVVAVEKQKAVEKEASPVAVAPPEKPLPPVPHKGTLIFVFDDAGHNLQQLQAFLDLPFNCCIAVLPRLKNSAETARRIRAAGKEVMLHQPMQSIDLSINPGDGAIKPGMTVEEAKNIVRQNIEEIAPISGMNNHEGSLISETYDLFKAAIEVAQEKGIYFLDSRTTPKTLGPKIGKELNMVVWERSVFLDNVKEKKAMKKEIERGLKIAEKNGQAIMIGHVFTTELAELLTEMYPQLKAEGFSLSTISEVASGKRHNK